MSELVVRGLSRSFGSVVALRGVDLAIPAGCLAAVLGPSGCGKTTLLRVIAGFLAPDAGSVSLGGRVVAGPGIHVAPERRGVGIVPQEGALFPHLTVGRNVAFGLPRAARRGSRRASELLELVGLAGYENRMPGELSGGQQQRVALARALAPEPALVLLDEPFSALDTALRASVRADVRRALVATGATAVLVTHDQQEALSTADVVAVMREGEVVQVAAPDALYAAPADLGVALFIGDAVVVPGVLDDGVVSTALGRLPVAAASGAGLDAGLDARGQAVLRPEQLSVTGAADGAVRARVTGQSYYGHDSVLELAVPDGVGERLVVLARVLGPQRWALGDEVGLLVSGTAMFYSGTV